MALTQKVCFYTIVGSFVSWFMWIMVEMIFGKGVTYNITGLLFGLSLSGIAALLYVFSFKQKKQNIVISVLVAGGLFSAALYILSYFEFITSY